MTERQRNQMPINVLDEMPNEHSFTCLLLYNKPHIDQVTLNVGLDAQLEWFALFICYYRKASDRPSAIKC